MAWARKVFALSACAPVAFMLMGCDSDYDSCNLTDIAKKEKEAEKGVGECYGGDRKKFLETELSTVEACVCKAYKPYLKEMIKYQKACADAGAGQIAVPLTNGRDQTTCGLTLPKVTAPDVPDLTTFPMDGHSPASLPSTNLAKVLSDKVLGASAKPFAAMTPSNFSSSHGQVSAWATSDNPIGQPAPSVHEEAVLSALEKVMWASIGALLIGGACLAAHWRSAAREMKMSAAGAELELSGTPTAATA